MKKLYLVTLLTGNAYADGLGDRHFYPIIPAGPGHVTIWVEKNGTHLLELQPRGLHVHPFLWRKTPSRPVEPHGVNYWYYFDKHKCLGEYARVFEGTSECTYEELDPKSIPIPEPRASLLLGISLAALAFYRKFFGNR